MTSAVRPNSGGVPPKPNNDNPKPRELSWWIKQWWKVERDFPAAPKSEQELAKLIQEGQATHAELHEEHPDKRFGIREEIRRDVNPFYLLGTKCRQSFIDVRAAMWLTHVKSFSQIRNRNDPDKAGSTEIDYVAGMLDIVDRKFGVLLSVQGLIGVVISVSISTFKDKLFALLKSPADKVLYVVCALFVVFLFSAWYGLALVKIKLVTLTGIASAGILFLIRQHLPDYLATSLIISLSWLWFTTTLVCLRGAGRVRWGEMRSTGTALVRTDLIGQLKTEHDYQRMNLIRALVGRTAIYRAGVLLVYSTLYCLIFTGYVTALVLTRSERAGPPVANIAKTLPDVSYDVHFAPGDTCDTSPDAMREIESIVVEVENRRPRGLLVIGSTDAMPMSRALARTVGDARELSMSRAECVSMRIAQVLRLKGESIPIGVTTRGAQDKSAQARILGNTADRVAEVRFFRPSTLGVQ